MFTRSPATEPKPLEPLKPNPPQGSSGAPPLGMTRRSGADSGNKSVISNDLKIIGQGLKIISHHMGGMIPYFSGKIKLGFRQIFFGAPDRNPAAVDAGLKRHPLDYYKMLYADTALGEVAPTRCGHAFFGTDRCVFATDAPFDSEEGRGLMRNTIAAVEALEIPRAEKEAIFSGNARKLLRL